MPEPRETYIFRYLGDPSNAKKEFTRLQEEGDVKILESTPQMVLGETSPSLISRLKSILTNWLVVPMIKYDYPDNEIRLKKRIKSKK